MAQIGKILVLVACSLALVGWAVSLGGIAKATDVCNGFYDMLNGESYSEKNNCARYYQWQWWGLWFTFGTALVTLVLRATNTLEGWETAFQAIAATNTAVVMLCARDTINRKADVVDGKPSNVGDLETSAADAAIAGFILSGIALMLLILTLSVRNNPDGSGISVQLKVIKSRPSTPNSGVAMNALAASVVATAVTSPGTSVVVTPERRGPEGTSVAGYPAINYAPDRWQAEQQQQQVQQELQAPPQAPPPPPAFPARPAENAV